MNGKITVIRRRERSGHRLQARLRTPGLVRPGAAVETRPVRPPLPGPRVRAAFGANPGGTAEGFAFRPRDGTRGVFCYHKDRRYEIEDRSFGIRQSRMIPIEPHQFLSPISTLLTQKRSLTYEGTTGSHSRRRAGSHRRRREHRRAGGPPGPVPGQKGRTDRRSEADGQALRRGAARHGPAGQRRPGRCGVRHRAAVRRPGGKGPGGAAGGRGAGHHRPRQGPQAGPQAPHVHRAG